MNERAAAIMSAVEQPLAVICVVGMYRTGKSFLMNRVVINTPPNTPGFQVGPTVNPCTKGLWMWGRPIKQKRGDTTVNIIVVDTEGIGALDANSTVGLCSYHTEVFSLTWFQHDARIFAMGLLASSYFVYNRYILCDFHWVFN